MEFTHGCTKCKVQYKTDDPDPYLCESCYSAKQKIAEQVDAQFASRPRTPPKTPLQEYDESAINVKGLKLMRYHP